jgi:hypothetical protein
MPGRFSSCGFLPRWRKTLLTAPEKRIKTVSVAIEYPDTLPPIVGYADAYAVFAGHDFHEIAFIDSRGEQAIARLIVDNKVLADHLWGNSAEFYISSIGALRAAGIEPTAAATKVPSLTGVRAVACNFFKVHRAGQEASVECYYVRPELVHEATQVKAPAKPAALKAIGIMHIQMSAAGITGMLERIRDAVNKPRQDRTE